MDYQAIDLLFLCGIWLASVPVFVVVNCVVVTLARQSMYTNSYRVLYQNPKYQESHHPYACTTVVHCITHCARHSWLEVSPVSNITFFGFASSKLDRRLPGWLTWWNFNLLVLKGHHQYESHHDGASRRRVAFLTKKSLRMRSQKFLASCAYVNF